MVVAEQLPNKLRQLPGKLKDQQAGDTRIKVVRLDVREDSSERPALFIVLVLSDPPAGAETWPAEDLWALRRIVREKMADTEAKSDWSGMSWFVVFDSEDHKPLDADDTVEQLDADG